MSGSPLASTISQHTLEVRYRPNAKILDRRGTWAEDLAAAFSLPHWQIIDNRVDVYDQSTRERLFVAFRNAGLICHDPDTANYFPDRATKLTSTLMKFEGFHSPLPIERLGVRSLFLTKHDGKFEDLLAKYLERLLAISPAAKAALDAKIIDAGAPMVLEDNVGTFNLTTGPMKKEQMPQQFQRSDDYEFPEIGLYIDIDYWCSPKDPLPSQELARRIRAFAESAWRRHEQLRRLVLGA